MVFWFSPTSADSHDALVASLREIGLSVGKGFEWHALDEPTRRGLARAVRAGEQIVDAKWAAAGETTNGWKYTFAGTGGLRSGAARWARQVRTRRAALTRCSTPMPASMTKASNSAARTNTSCTSMLASSGRCRCSGTWRCMAPTCCSSRTASVDTALAARRTA
jgi:hypothetical protein